MSESTEELPHLDIDRDLVENLSNRILDQYPTHQTHRRISLHTAYPIVSKDGRPGDAGMLWPFLQKLEGFTEHRERNSMLSALRGEDYNFAMTVGRSQMEVQIPLCDSLQELEERLRRATQEIAEAASQWQQVILAYGAQPIQKMDPESLTHIYHYFSLLRKLKEGYCYQGVQAKGNIYLSVNRGELLDLFNLGHILSPVFLFFSANSIVLNNETSYRPSGRLYHQSQLQVGDGRWQMIDSPYSGIDEWIFHLFYQPHLLLKDPEGWLDPAQGYFAEYCQGKTALEVWDDFVDHRSTLWTAAQPKPEEGVLQFNEIEQGGIEQQLALSALALGLADAGKEVVQWLEDLVPDPPPKRGFGLWPEDILRKNLAYRKDPWTPLHQYWMDIIQRSKMEEPFSGLLEGCLDLADRALIARGFGEESYLQPLRHRLMQKEAPHLELQRIWLRSGIKAFVEHLAI